MGRPFVKDSSIFKLMTNNIRENGGILSINNIIMKHQIEQRFEEGFDSIHAVVPWK